MTRDCSLLLDLSTAPFAMSRFVIPFNWADRVQPIAEAMAADLDRVCTSLSLKPQRSNTLGFFPPLCPRAIDRKTEPTLLHKGRTTAYWHVPDCQKRTISVGSISDGIAVKMREIAGRSRR